MKKRKLIATSIISISLVCSAMTVVFADPQHYHQTGFGNSAVNLKSWNDSSVSSYGYTTYANDGVNAWKNITNNLKITAATSIPTYGSIVSYVGNTIPGLDVYGVVDYWTYGLFGWSEVDEDDLRDRSRIRYDHTNLGTMTTTEVKYVFAHEAGHAVGLYHNNTSGVASVMRDQAVVFTNNVPQTADKNHIIEKYGN